MEKIRYTLENLDCAGCAAKAEAAVNKAPWIEKATVDFMNKRRKKCRKFNRKFFHLHTMKYNSNNYNCYLCTT